MDKDKVIKELNNKPALILERKMENIITRVNHNLTKLNQKYKVKQDIGNNKINYIVEHENGDQVAYHNCSGYERSIINLLVKDKKKEI